MQKVFLSVFVLFLMLAVGCAKKEQSQEEIDALKAGFHKVEALEVIQVSSYTYLRVSENGSEYWLAGPKMDAKKGEFYYYEKGMEMKGFKSTELDKTFDSILFVNEISDKLPTAVIKGTPPMGNTPQKPAIEKTEVSVEKYPGGISIAELFASSAKYAGKEVKIRGKVTKVNNGIMGKNWLHIQDGTENKGDFDLTVTTAAEFNVGDVIAFSGKIAIDKDFGYGYSYKVLLEDAVAIK
ncbi:MAG: SH3-like domain-containing protein [Ignavibacteriales bacterium]|nr:SH3-like domain-containing protein [Ignavibacteriales bacterium]